MCDKFGMCDIQDKPKVPFISDAGPVYKETIWKGEKGKISLNIISLLIQGNLTKGGYINWINITIMVPLIIVYDKN